MPWLHIHEFDSYGKLLELTGSNISCNWQKNYMSIYQGGNEGELTTVWFKLSSDLIEAIRDKERFIDTAEEGMNFYSCS